MKLTMKSSNVRKNWSSVIDNVVRDKPMFIMRNRDMLAIMSVDQMNYLLEPYKLTMNIIQDKKGEYSGYIEEFDLSSNGKSFRQLRDNIIRSLIKYSYEYMENFRKHYYAFIEKDLFPYVYKILANENNIGEILDMIEIHESGSLKS